MINLNYENVRSELTNYYVYSGEARANAERIRADVFAEMNAFTESNPDLNAFKLKAEQYRCIAEHTVAVLFRSIPFYFETGALHPFSDGCCHRGMVHANAFAEKYNGHKITDAEPEITKLYRADMSEKLYLGHGLFFDSEHFKIPLKKVFESGLSGIMKEACEALEICTTEHERDFINAVIASLKAEKLMADKFAAEARRCLESETDPDERKNLSRIADTASRIPWEKPESVYEGLCAMAFLRKAVGSIEGVGFNSFGRIDKLLEPLYNRDIARGITKDEILDLICRFILIWDSHVDRRKKMEGYDDYEYENSMTLGGCDINRNEVFNDITRMIIEAHDSLGTMFPKIACRYSAKSSKEYLELISRPILSEKSILLYVNDDSYIPALLRRKISLQDAYDYTISGCWGVSIEDYYKSACGYINTLKAIEWGMNPPLEKLKNQQFDVFHKLSACKSFDEVYEATIDNIIILMRRKAEFESKGVRHWSEGVPVPAYSALLIDTLPRRLDFSEGGGRYNWEVMYLAALPDTIDSLLAIKSLCFDKKLCTLEELARECRENWPDEQLRLQATKSPGYGDGSEESARMTGKVIDDIYRRSREFPTVYGGEWQLSSFMYTEIIWWGKQMSATPNGRHDGDYISQGLTPSRLHQIKSVTDVFSGLRHTDMTELSSGSVINVVLPAMSVNADVLDAFFRGCAKAGTHIMQVNCVSREELEAAIQHPEDYGHIIVRVCGFSAPFVSLSSEFQKEFLTRNFYES